MANQKKALRNDEKYTKHNKEKLKTELHDLRYIRNAPAMIDISTKTKPYERTKYSKKLVHLVC